MSTFPPNVVDHFAGGLSDPHSPQFKHRRHVFDIVNRLHSYGLHHQMDIPQIAVVGSQSVGKSSLIESISGITLPRASGTCTRCPIECRLSRTDAPWSCEVYLRFARNARDIQFGNPITNKADVQERIRRAQLAILNPTQPTISFLQPTVAQADRNELSFSTDLISVHIRGRDVDDLSFVDLPGVIASVREGGREADIQEVRDLVTSFIKRPSCLILLVISCETDLENQGARSLAKKLDANGRRTIPVLTKPDRIGNGEHDTWLRLLENQTERYRHGWHCVKQSDQEQLNQGISWAEARQNEIDYFNKQPWSTLEESIRSRLGTKFLTQNLGSILFELIGQRLPGLVQELEKKVTITRGTITDLPKTPKGDPVGIVWKLITTFQNNVSQLIAGRAVDGADGLLQSFRKGKKIFRIAIKSQAPQFWPYHKNAINVKKDLILRFTADWIHPARSFFRTIFRQLTADIKASVEKQFSQFSAGEFSNEVLRHVITQLSRCEKNTIQKMEECFSLERAEPLTANEDRFIQRRSHYLSNYKAIRRNHKYDDGEIQKFLKGEFQNSPYMQSAVQNLQAMGFQKVSHVELLRLLPEDEAEDALLIMAEVSAYYEVAYRRFIDNISLTIDSHLFKAFAESLDDVLFSGLSLSGDGARQRCQAFIQEDPEVTRRRASLDQDLERFENAFSDLQNIPGVSLTGGGHSYINDDEEDDGNSSSIVDDPDRPPSGSVSVVRAPTSSRRQEIPLPGLLLEEEKILCATQKAFAELPAKPEGDPVGIVWKLLAAFQKEVTLLLVGRPEDGSSGLLQSFRKGRKAFKEAIEHQAPKFLPYSGSMVETPGGHSKTTVDLDEVIKMARDAITRELPGNYPYAVKKNYVYRFTEDWLIPARALFDRMQQQFMRELKTLVESHLSQFGAGQFDKEALGARSTQCLCHKYNPENGRMFRTREEEPSTNNEDRLSELKEELLATYKAERQRHRKHDNRLQKLVNGEFQNTTIMGDAVRNLQAMGISNVTQHSLLRSLPTDEAEDAIEIMAEMRAYYEVDYRRFVDYTPLIIDYRLFKGFERTLNDALFTGLSLGGDGVRERCTAFLQEDPEIMQRRGSLSQDLERF
ncbi:hypothetical protein PIIN_04366 [Serendipita indica DSM 11827]|uniref:Uncharacterized protein n=1 Tax=Serendipita indica (strain DSM 11827) TaxID=1109443 RepID=G4TGH9_SERID|nr:hypothetical protein PIIN_04366 [Serendipita indica DSM 11827]